MIKLVSVITVTLNNKVGLEKTLASVISQRYDGIEIIIIDGGSTDGTLDVLKWNRERITYFVSEKDKGIYHAMNKGILKATGEYVLFLNSGDYFNGELAISTLISQSQNEDIVYGDIIFKKESAEVLKTYPDVLDFGFFVETTLPHPSTLIKKKLFLDYGLYNEHIKISADWAFFINVIGKYKTSYRHISHPVSYFLMGGASSDVEKVKCERESYLKSDFDFYFRRYQILKIFERKIFHLRKSRLLRILSKILPKDIRNAIYE